MAADSSTPRVLRRIGPAAALFATLLLSAASISNSNAQSADPIEKKRELEARRAEKEAEERHAKQQLEGVREDIRERADAIEKLNARLLETGALIQNSEARMSAIEARLGELEAQERLLQGSLAQRHDQVAKLMSALLRMGRNPPPVIITKREDALQMVRSAMLLAAAFPELKGQAVSLASRLNELVRVMTDIRTEGDRLKTETARLSDARTRLAGLMDTKKQSLTERQAELEGLRRSVAAITKNVGDLSEMIGKMDREVTAKTGLGAYEEEIRQQQAAAPVTSAEAPAAALDAKPETVKPHAAIAPKEAAASKGTQVAALSPPPKSAIIELAPSSGGLSASPGRIKPAIPFQQAKTRLPLPAQGRRVLTFGEKTQTGTTSKGLVLETRSGAQVTAPCDGWVVYAGEFRSYGQLLIINAGGGYHVLLAGLSQIDAQPGQFVLAAEPIGTMMGTPTASAAKAQAAAPVLYVEFRKDGRPIDPDPWWVEGHQKVQG